MLEGGEPAAFSAEARLDAGVMLVPVGQTSGWVFDIQLGRFKGQKRY